MPRKNLPKIVETKSPSPSPAEYWETDLHEDFTPSKVDIVVDIDPVTMAKLAAAYFAVLEEEMKKNPREPEPYKDRYDMCWASNFDSEEEEAAWKAQRARKDTTGKEMVVDAAFDEVVDKIDGNDGGL